MFIVMNTVFGQALNQMDKEGNRIGKWKKYYKTGNIRYEGQFDKGKEIGVFKYYSIASSSHPVIIKEYQQNNDTAQVKFYNVKGKLKSIGYMIRKKRVGEWNYYFSNGKTMSQEHYHNGLLHGVLKNYYANGKLTETTNYTHGEKDGVSKIFTEDGIIIEEVNYVAGKKHGKAVFYDLKGNIKERGNYKNGIRDGKWEFYMDGEVVKKKRNNLGDFKQK